MRKIIFGLALAAAGIAGAHASDKTDVMSTVHQWVDGFNKGDAKASAAVCADETSIVDDFPPHEWHGSGACAKWFGELLTYVKTEGITIGSVGVRKPKHLEVTGDVAYLVAPAYFKFTQKGKPVNEPAVVTMSFKKTADGWRITGWGWADQ